MVSVLKPLNQKGWTLLWRYSHFISSISGVLWDQCDVPWKKWRPAGLVVHLLVRWVPCLYLALDFIELSNTTLSLSQAAATKHYHVHKAVPFNLEVLCNSWKSSYVGAQRSCILLNFILPMNTNLPWPKCILHWEGVYSWPLYLLAL